MADRIRHFTVLDAIQHLFRWGGLGNTEASWELARMAVRSALEELASAYPWSYYHRRGTIALTGSDTGTTDFDLTGGTYERECNRSSGSFPTWAARGTIQLSDGFEYPVEDRKESGVLSLAEGAHPSGDLASTPYTLYRDSYELPNDVARCDRMFISENQEELEYLPPADFYRQKKKAGTTGVPKYWTMLGDADEPGRMLAQFLPYPGGTKTVYFVYQKRPREPLIDSYSYKTASSSSTTVTGTETSFTSNMVGSIIRFGYSNTDEGNQLDSQGQWFERMAMPRPYIYERRITAYSSATSLTIDEALTSASVKFVISDPIDIEPIFMRRVFLRCAERQLSILNREAYLQEAERLYQQELQAAILADESRKTTLGPQQSVASRTAREGMSSASGRD